MQRIPLHNYFLSKLLVLRIQAILGFITRKSNNSLMKYKSAVLTMRLAFGHTQNGEPFKVSCLVENICVSL